MEPENRIATATILALQAAVRMLIDEVETGHQGSAARTLALGYARRVLAGDIQRRDAPSIYPQADEAPIERPSRSERQMRNMEADAAAVLQARDEEIARLRDVEAKARALLASMETPRSQKASDAWWALSGAIKS